MRLRLGEQVYRLYNDENELLYIGISWSALHRLAQHAKNQPWWHEVATIKIQSYPACTRTMAMLIEREAIIREKPKYNIAHGGDVWANHRNRMQVGNWIIDWRRTGSKCRVCGKKAIYDFPEDRFFHTDGSDNQDCWVAILRREA